MKINFEYYLIDKFMKDEPCILDDDFIDAYESWIDDNFEYDRIVKWANDWASKLMVKKDG